MSIALLGGLPAPVWTPPSSAYFPLLPPIPLHMSDPLFYQRGRPTVGKRKETALPLEFLLGVRHCSVPF